MAKPKTKCLLCGADHYSHGCCLKCLRRVKKLGIDKITEDDSLDEIRKDISLISCGNYGKPRIFKEYDPAKDACVICGALPTKTKNMCNKHYTQLLKHGMTECEDLDEIKREVFPEAIESHANEDEDSNSYFPQFGDSKDITL